jgi:L-alanine-DL-glutamate epimerase-like enolase superfamily enzyme
MSATEVNTSVGGDKEMKITKVRAVSHKVQNVMTGWKTSLGGHDTHELIFVRIDTDEKIFGIGVASPGAIFISGDTGVNHLELINHRLGPAIVGANPFDLEAIMHELDSVVSMAERAKAGIDLALHDLTGKALGVPANRLFGGAIQPRVRVTRLMGMYEPTEMAEKSKALVQRGYTALKLKVGTTLKEDVERVQRVREAVGPEVTITIDFNQACSPKEAIQRINQMEPYHVTLVEQPVKSTDLKGMALVRQSVSPLVMADESVCSSADALRIVEDGAADVISLKIPKMGGIFKARKVAAVCEAAGIDYLVGTAPGSRLLDAANVHLAASLRNLTLPCEIGEFERMANDPCKGLEIVDGFSSPPQAPGLGVEVDLAKIGLVE